MSTNSGYPPPPPPPPAYQPTTPNEPSDIPLWVILGAVGAMLVGIALLAVVVLQNLSEDDEKKPSYPATWDPRIAPYVKIVEKERGLTFMHPVAVRFLSDVEFKKTVTGDEKDLDKGERKEIDQATGLLRALGLLTGDVDLFKALNTTSGSGTLAYYSFEDERITIRGQQLTPVSRATLVHELTHVLQDQHFDIGDVVAKLDKSKDPDSGTEGSVLDAIIEGDANRVEALYRVSLNAKQRRNLAASEAKQNGQAGKELTKVPKVILTMFQSPYTLGEALVQAVASNGGNHAVDGLLRDAPTHEASLFDPFQVLAGDLGAKKVDAPKLEKGDKKLGSGEFGVLTWYFMLAERVPLMDALSVADGWGGDAYTDFERGGVSCARIAYEGDSPPDTTRMYDALRRWIAAAPGSPAKVTRDGVLVQFESCDPGKAAKVGKNASIDAMSLAVSRTNLGINIMRSGAPEDLARCLADRLVREYSIRQLADPKFGAKDTGVKARVRQLALACR